MLIPTTYFLWHRHKNMHCSLQRDPIDKQKIACREEGYSPRKLVKPDSLTIYAKAREVCDFDPSIHNHRCAVIFFFMLEGSSGQWRCVEWPTWYADHLKQYRSLAKVDKDSLSLSFLPAMKVFKADTLYVLLGSAFFDACFVNLFASGSFPHSSLQYRSQSKSMSVKVFKPNDLSSKSITCNDSYASFSEGYTDTTSSGMFIDNTTLKNSEKKTSKKKVRRKGKHKKTLSTDTGSAETEVISKESHGISLVQTYVANDPDHVDQIVACLFSQEVSSLDERFAQNSLKTWMHTPCNKDVNCDGPQIKSSGVTILNRELEEVSTARTSNHHDTCSNCSSDTLESISVNSTGEDNVDDIHDVKATDKEGSNISLPGSPSPNCGNKCLFHENSSNGDVLTSRRTGPTKNSNWRFNKRCMQNASSGGKRVDDVKTLSGSRTSNIMGRAEYSRGCAGKENIHSIWKKIQRKDGDECRYEMKNTNTVFVQSQVDAALSDASFAKRNYNNSEISLESKGKDNKPFKYRVPSKLKRKTNPGVKQEFYRYSRWRSYPNKSGSRHNAKMSIQQKHMLTISGLVHDEEGVGSVLKSQPQSCSPKIESQTCRVDSMSSESIMNSLQVFPAVFMSHENINDTVSGINRVDHDPTLPESCLSQDALQLLDMHSTVVLPHVCGKRVLNIPKANFLPENCKQNHSSVSVLQKWMPLEKKDLNKNIILKCTRSLVDHSDRVGGEDLNWKSIVVQKVDSNSDNMLSSQSDILLMAGGCSPHEKEDNQRGHPIACFCKRDNNTITTYCPTSVLKGRNYCALEADSKKIARAVNTVFRVQMDAEAVQMATRSPFNPLERLLHLSTPVICQLPNFIYRKPCSRNQPVSPYICRDKTPYIKLGCLWEWYEKHGNYGLEVRGDNCENSTSSGVDGFSFHAYFVPLLSAIQLFKLQPSDVAQSCEIGERSQHFSVLRQLPIFSKLFPYPHTSVNVDQPRPASVHSKEEIPSQPADLECSSDPELLFEYFESEQPQRRQPLYEKIQELVGGDRPSHGNMYGDPTTLNHVCLHELHPRSWYSVAWYPIYRIPDGNLRATFLTYHSLSHLVCRHSGFGSADGDVCIVSPVVGLHGYNTQGECWFQPRNAAMITSSKTYSLNPSEVMKEQLRKLEESASLIARAVVKKGNQTVINKHPDYEFFLSRRC